MREPHDSTGEPGAGNRPAGFGERGEETYPRDSACGPVAKAPDKPPTPYRLRASPRLYLTSQGRIHPMNPGFSRKPARYRPGPSPRRRLKSGPRGAGRARRRSARNAGEPVRTVVRPKGPPAAAARRPASAPLQAEYEAWRDSPEPPSCSMASARLSTSTPAAAPEPAEGVRTRLETPGARRTPRRDSWENPT